MSHSCFKKVSASFWVLTSGFYYLHKHEKLRAHLLCVCVCVWGVSSVSHRQGFLQSCHLVLSLPIPSLNFIPFILLHCCICFAHFCWMFLCIWKSTHTPTHYLFLSGFHEVGLWKRKQSLLNKQACLGGAWQSLWSAILHTKARGGSRVHLECCLSCNGNEYGN